MPLGSRWEVLNGTMVPYSRGSHRPPLQVANLHSAHIWHTCEMTILPPDVPYKEDTRSGIHILMLKTLKNRVCAYCNLALVNDPPNSSLVVNPSCLAYTITVNNWLKTNSSKNITDTRILRSKRKKMIKSFIKRWKFISNGDCYPTGADRI